MAFRTDELRWFQDFTSPKMSESKLVKKCEHGNPPPWYNCEKCQKESHYSFTGDFK